MVFDEPYDPTDAPPDVTADADLPPWVRVLADFARCERSAHRERVARAFEEGHIDASAMVDVPADVLMDLSRWAVAAREFYERFGTDYTDREEYDVTWAGDEAPFPDAQWCLQTLAATLVMLHREGCEECRAPRRDDGRMYLVPVDGDAKASTPS